MHIVITASGIQDYIFDITQRAASTRLRGRSARLGLVLDCFRQRIHEKFAGKLTVTVERDAGSRLEIQFPDGAAAEEVMPLVDSLQAEMDRHSIKELDSQVWFTAIAVESRDALNKELTEAKLNPGRAALQSKDEASKGSVWNQESFTFPRKTDERRLQREEDEARELPEALLGRVLARKETGFFRFTPTDTKKEIPILDQFVEITEHDPGGGSVRFSLKHASDGANLLHKRMCRYAPMDVEEQRLLTLGEIADRSTGAKFLGVLKADLDNAGKVFRAAGGDRYRSLSNDVDLFFTEHMEQLVRGKYGNCYVVYSGGDDLFLLGPWDQLIRFALELRKRLTEDAKEWKAEALTLSAGFKLAHFSSPVRYLAADAEAALQSAKAGEGKNCISVFERVLQWDEVKEGLQWADAFREAAADRKLSVGFLQRLQYYAGKSRRYFEDHQLDALSMIPLLQNDWSRNKDQVEEKLRSRMESGMLPILKQLNQKGERMWRIADFASRFACYALR